MKRTLRSMLALLTGVVLLAGLTGCNGLPEEIVSRLPELSRTATPSPEESETTEAPEPEQSETATEEPAPETTDPAPEATVTETVTSSPSAETSSEPAVDDEATDEPIAAWVWWLIGGLLLILVVVGILLWRAMAKRAEWDRRLEGARSEFAWLEDSVVPQILAKPTASEASALWQAARPRVLETDKALHALGEDAPTEDRTETARQGLEVFRALVDALEDETSTYAGTDSDALRARRAALDAARTEARRWIAEARR